MNRKYDKTKDKSCETPHLTAEEIKAAFLTAANEYLSGSSRRLADAEFIREYAGNTTELEARCDALTAEMNAMIEQTQNLIGENASVAMDQKVYAERKKTLRFFYASVTNYSQI